MKLRMAGSPKLAARKPNARDGGMRVGQVGRRSRCIGAPEAKRQLGECARALGGVLPCMREDQVFSVLIHQCEMDTSGGEMIEVELWVRVAIARRALQCEQKFILRPPERGGMAGRVRAAQEQAGMNVLECPVRRVFVRKDQADAGADQVGCPEFGRMIVSVMINPLQPLEFVYPYQSGHSRANCSFRCTNSRPPGLGGADLNRLAMDIHEDRMFYAFGLRKILSD